MLVLALSSHDIDNAIFKIAAVLEVPVLVLALIALATIIFEIGTFAVEVSNRLRHRTDLETATASARRALLANDDAQARHAAAGLARSAPMARALSTIVSHARVPGGEHRLGKALADFDYQSQSRLARTRLLVRAGPAIGLMGTLIPLSPALTGLAEGNVTRLSTNLRIAFSVTVLGLLVGAVAFGLSIYRDRMYGQDLSDLEYVAAVVSDPRELPDIAPPPDVAPDSSGEPTAALAVPQEGGSPVPPGTGGAAFDPAAGGSPLDPGSGSSPLVPGASASPPTAAASDSPRSWRRLIRRAGGTSR
jgi:biopolymer transport protein ExbB/TolQ